MADVESLCDRAHAWARQGRYREAEAAYREAARIDPGRLKAYLGLGLVLRRQRRPAEAEAIFKHAILLKPDGVSAHVELGGALFEQTRYPEAAAAFREAIRLRPDSPQAHVSLGLALARQGDYAGAESALRQARHGSAQRIGAYPGRSPHKPFRWLGGERAKTHSPGAPVQEPDV